jgi:PAS domain S-box-containing protein
MATTARTALFLLAILFLLSLYVRKKWRLYEAEKSLEMERRLREEERQQKQIEEKLLLSEKIYYHLFDNMLDGIVHVNMDGIIISCNKAYQDMLGYSRDEILKLTYVDITPPKWHDFEKRIIEEQIIPEGHSKIYDKEYIKKDGTIFPVELRTYLVTDEQGLSMGMWAIVRDITDRKRAEVEIRQLNASLEERVRKRTAQLEASNMELEAFSYSVSHDLRTPLRAIDGFSLILAEEYQGKLDDEGKRVLDVIRSNTQQMAQLIDDILKLSQDGLVPVDRCPAALGVGLSCSAALALFL